MEEKRLGRNELVKVSDSFKLSFDPLRIVMVLLLQMRTKRIYKEEKRSINITDTKKIIYMQGKRIKGCTQT